MRRRAGIRRWVRWGGVATLVVIAAVWGASFLWYALCLRADAGAGIALGKGALDGWGDWPVAWSARYAWFVHRYNSKEPFPLIWLPRLIRNGPDVSVHIPLWIPWLLAAGFTFWRFRADRIATKGLCPACGYDTTGLAAGAPCPECGKK